MTEPINTLILLTLVKFNKFMKIGGAKKQQLCLQIVKESDMFYGHHKKESKRIISLLLAKLTKK